MPSSWMEGLDYFKYRSLGIFSLLGSTVYHDSAVNCGTVPSEEAFLLAVLLLLQTLSLLEVLFLWEGYLFFRGQFPLGDYFFAIPFSLMKASRASPPSMLLTQSVRMLTFSGATTFSTFSVLALTQ